MRRAGYELLRVYRRDARWYERTFYAVRDSLLKLIPKR